MKQDICVISGTGRAGTSFLVHLLTNAGYDTGFKKEEINLHPDSRAGLEHDLRGPGPFPMIVKDPHFCFYAEEVVNRFNISSVVIPIRALHEAAASRVAIHRLNKGINPEKPTHGGGLFGTNDEQLQEQVLAMAFYRLIYFCISHKIPYTLLDYRQMMDENSGYYYIYNKLHTYWPFCFGADMGKFWTAHKEVLNKNWLQHANNRTTGR